MKKILVIDDEEWLRQMIRMALKQRGHEVTEAGNGLIGVELARKELPDLVLCDVNMVKMGGYETLQALRSDPTTAAIPFILMTGLADQAGMRQGMELGADDYLPKPFTIDNLHSAVDARLKKAEMVRQKAEAELANLRSNISLMLPHELRTPLNGILAYGEILATDAATLQPAEVAEMGQVIADSGKRLQRLIENFLIYTQIEILQADPQKINLLRAARTRNYADLIKSHADQHAAAFKRTGDLILELTEQAVAIAENYVVKIVDELIQNAFKFSEPGTPIRISLATQEKTAVLTIVDKGRGMSAEQIKAVDAFVQHERERHEQQGTGLGLVIARMLVEIHGGNFTIQSQPTAGTTIIVTLPAAAA